MPPFTNWIEVWSAYWPSLIRAAAILVAAWAGVWLLRHGTRQARKRLRSQADDPRTDGLINLISLASQIGRLVIWVLAIFTILGTFGVNLAPVAAGLGVVGLAVSLGAQTLFKDYFGGIMILLENQFAVGDWVTVGPVSGTVERLTLRSTTLRDLQGKLHIVPNGEVRIVTNASRDWSLAQVDLNLALDTDLQHALEVLEAASANAGDDPALHEMLLEMPKVQGWTKLLDWAVQVRLSARARPDRRAEAEIVLRRIALEALRRGDVRLARMPTEIRDEK